LAVDICDDKYLFSQTLQEKGFGDVISKFGIKLPYPYMLKQRTAQSGDNCYIISNPDNERKFEDLLNDEGYYCQQLIKGANEYATHIIFIDHKITSFIIKYVFLNDAYVKGKDKFTHTKICDCPYLDLFSSILTAIEFEGLCCFNYKVVDGKPLIFEINPRFGGSLSTFFFSFVRRLEKENN
jgi:carbamoylphosphate synthase large subunit